MSEICKDLGKLHPFLQKIAAAFLTECKKQGLNIGISETYRSVERQDYLYAQGRTRPGNIITYSKGSSKSSYHQWGLAFDIFNNVKGDEWNVSALKKAAVIAKKMGLEWGGDWTGFKDMPHMQYTFGLSIADLKAGKKPPTAVQTKGDEEVKKKIKILINGNIKEVEVIQEGGNNYVKLQDMRDYWITVDFDTMTKMPVVDVRARS